MKKFTICTFTNYERRHLAVRFLESLRDTIDIDAHDIVVYENGDEGNPHKLRDYLFDKLPEVPFKVIGKPERSGLAQMWNWAMDMAKTDHVVLCNDDCISRYDWPAKVSMYYRVTQQPIHLICTPNGFSGFCVYKPFWHHFGFRNEYPGGYYEDEDYFLSVASANGITKHKYMMERFFLSYHDTSRMVPFKHQPMHIKDGVARAYTKWNKRENFDVFVKYWKEVPKGTENAIEGKGGGFYLPNKGD